MDGYAIERRHRRSAQRGQEHHLQRAHSVEAVAANYPFCTIEPNVGIVPVPDERQDKIVALVKPNSIVPTVMEFVDIAGLVAGASKGEGLGNQFLANIRSTDATLHIVRCFEDNEIIHVAGKVDPISDIDVINTELMLADLDTVTRRHEKSQKLATQLAGLARSRTSSAR